MAVFTVTGGGAPVPLTTDRNFPLIGVVLPTGPGGATTGNLYVSKQQSVSPNNFDKIVGINGQFSYPASTSPYTVWVTTDPGATCTYYYDTDGSTVDLGTLADGSVVDIGSVLEPVIVIPQNKADTLLTTTGIPLTIPAGTTYTHTFGPLNGYSTLNFIISGLGQTTPGVAVDSVFLIWRNVPGTSNPNIIASDEWAFDLIGEAQVQVPVKSGYVTLQIQNQSGTDQTVNIVAEGLSALLPATYRHYYGGNPPLINSLTLLAYGGTVNRGGISARITRVGATGTLYIDHIAGPAFYYTQEINAATGGRIDLLASVPTGSAETPVFISELPSDAIAYNSQPIVLPWAPLSLQLTGGATLQQIRVGLQYTKQ